MTTSQPQSQLKMMQANRKLPRLKSVGTRLFLLVMGGALVGLGSMAYLFYNSLRKEVEAEIRQTLSSKVNLIDGQVQQAEALAKSLRTTVATLHAQGVETPETYIKLTLELFKNRPDYVTGLGFMQREYGVLPKKPWFGPYYLLDPGVPDFPGKLLPAPDNKIRYVDENTPGDFYPESDYWKDYMVPQKTLWADPYEYYGFFYTTFYIPIYDDQKQWLGGVSVDFDARTFEKSLQDKVIREAGYFALLTDSGQIVAYPPDPQKGLKAETVKSIPGLESVWSRLQNGQSGLIKERGTYWVYQRIPSTNWVALASVPSEVVLRPVLLITVGGAVAAGLLLAGIVVVAVQYLNRRLKPILDKCNKLAATDAQTLARLANEDEVGRVSVSFFNLIDQLATKEEQIRQEVARAVQAQEELKRAVEVEREGEALQAEVGQLLEVVAAVEEGDFTVQAPVSDRVTGLVADTFNRLIEEIAKVLAQVLEAARQVSAGADNLEQIAEVVVTNADRQAQEVEQALSLSERVERSAESAAQQLQVSNQSLLTLDSTVLDGQAAMADLTRATEMLRQGTDRIVQQMKTLGEFVGLTEQLVRDQNQIAMQTQVLALNASLVAARACEQQNPRQFAVAAKEFEAIADQVSKLAQQTNEGLSVLEQRTTQVQNVVAAVDAGVQNLGGLVGGFTEGVERSTEAFNNVQMVTANVLQAGEAVTQSSQDIINTVRSTAAAMRDIAELAQRTVRLTQNTRHQSETMGDLSTRLLQRVEFFRLPTELLLQSSSESESVDLSETGESAGSSLSPTVRSVLVGEE
ncbi:MAG: methyl-accepting chemotaxis protein [Hydrococcus sp. C42_A2020_068]|nr:methyl-accepting chemotaxis protein [Hydrococcus sp. C42_A2020_068]